MENTIQTLSIRSVREMYLNDTKANAKNHTCNDAIISLCNMLDNNAQITCEVARNGKVLNRGSVVECLIKLLLKNQKSASKYSAGRVDLKLNNHDYEIKYTNSVAYASISEKQLKDYENGEYKELIMVDPYGVYRSNTKYYNFAKNGKIKGISKVLETLVRF